MIFVIPIVQMIKQAQGDDVTCSKPPLSQPGLQPKTADASSLSLPIRAMDRGTWPAFSERHML